MVWRRRQTLSTFVHALEGSRVVVELRYDTIIRGLLQQVDSEMNLTLVNVSCRPLEGKVQEMEFMYIKGRHVRYIHFPGSINAATLIEDRRARAKQMRLVHARELGAQPTHHKGWQACEAGEPHSDADSDAGGSDDDDPCTGGDGAWDQAPALVLAEGWPVPVEAGAPGGDQPGGGPHEPGAPAHEEAAGHAAMEVDDAGCP